MKLLDVVISNLKNNHAFPEMFPGNEFPGYFVSSRRDSLNQDAGMQNGLKDEPLISMNKKISTINGSDFPDQLIP